MSDSVRFTLDGHEVEAFNGETIWQVAHRLGTDIPHLCYAHEPGYRADGNCRACMVEVEGERVLAASCSAAQRQAWWCTPPPSGRKPRAHGDGDAGRRPAGARGRAPARFKTLAVGRAHGRHRESAPVPARGGPGPEPSRDARQPRRLHPLQPVRAGLPRGAGQRRHRHGLARHRLEDRLRLRRPDGREHLRRLRRVRAGVPDRRADGGGAGRRGRGRPPAPARGGGERLPLLRGRLPDHLPAPGQPRGRCRGQGPETTPETRPGARSSPRYRAATAPPTTSACA